MLLVEEYRRESGIPIIRTFIALPVAGSPVDAVSAMIRDMQQAGVGAKWVEARNMHLTLKFLGDLPRTRIQPLADAVNHAVQGEPRFEIELRGAGAFPSPRNPRVFWVGVREGAGRLTSLARSIDESTVARGFTPADKAFRPHLTIGRARGESADTRAADIISRNSDTYWGTVLVDCIHVVASVLQPSGPIYTSLARIPLE